MGLTIHYDLRAPHIASAKSARALLSRLHAYAASLNFEYCSKIVHWDHRSDEPFMGQMHHHLVRYEPTPGEEKYLSVEPLSFHMFAVSQPGSESACFGLGRYRDFGTDLTDSSIRLPAHLPGFHWDVFCKTQYASLTQNGGFDNFLKIHDGICKILDHAATLGIQIEVHDEGNYWPNRDRHALQKTVDHWNNLIAAFTGKIKDVIGNHPGGVVAPITDDPTFEHMEAKGEQLFNPSPDNS